LLTFPRSKGDYGKALVWYQLALDGARKDHPSILGTVDNMAGNFPEQGDYGKALVWYQLALTAERKRSER